MRIKFTLDPLDMSTGHDQQVMVLEVSIKCPRLYIGDSMKLLNESICENVK
jgi:hypothetical protein